jgi:GNAT superfamily N-acetyltransferase
MKIEKGEYLLTDNSKSVDLEFVTRELQKTYWAKGRTKNSIKKSITNSFNFSLFKDKEQIGYLRVVSDGVLFAWICDFVISKKYRGQGLGKWMFARIMKHPALKVKNRLLKTKDAHKLYEKFSFRKDECMRSKSKNIL